MANVLSFGIHKVKMLARREQRKHNSRKMARGGCAVRAKKGRNQFPAHGCMIRPPARSSQAMPMLRGRTS